MPLVRSSLQILTLAGQNQGAPSETRAGSIELKMSRGANKRLLRCLIFRRQLHDVLAFGRKAPVARCSRASHRRLHTRGAEALPRIPLIVSSTTQSQILNRALAAQRPGLDVVELQAPTRPAPSPIRRDIAALLAVTQHHRPRNRRRDRTPPLQLRARVSLWPKIRLGWGRHG